MDDKYLNFNEKRMHIFSELVNEFGEDSVILTPFDNLNAVKILRQFEIRSIEEIPMNEGLKKILSRD